MSPDCGGSVEVFDSTEDARNRYEYLKAVTKKVSFLTEYDFLVGTTLLRVSRSLTPKQAAEYETALTPQWGAPRVSRGAQRRAIRRLLELGYIRSYEFGYEVTERGWSST